MPLLFLLKEVNEMQWCKVNKEYLLYLKRFEERVPDFEYYLSKPDGTRKRLFKPFFYMLKDCGTYCFVGQVNHYEHKKHDKLKDAQDFKKVYDMKFNKPLCVVNLNYVFPVPKNELSNITANNISKERDFDSLKEKSNYISLLRSEIKSINSMNLEIYFEKLYTLKYQKPFHAVAKRCFDYKYLENKCSLWEKHPTIKGNLFEPNEVKKNK